LIVPTLILVTLVVFIAIRILPTDIADLIVAEGGVGGSAVTKDAIRAQLKLDQPLPIQYLYFVRDVANGSLGYSAYDRKPVSSKIRDAMPVTLQLASMSIVISWFLALGIGIISALRQDTPVDYTIRVASILSFSAPIFWTGTLLVIFPAIWWHYFPPILFVPFISNPTENLRQFFLPALTLGIYLSGSVARMVRSSMLEVLRQDYIRTARAKGLRDRLVITRHSLKNALIPVITFSGLQLAGLLGGTVIVESIFALPGMGRLTIDAVFEKDYPLIQGNVLFFAFIVVFINLIVDLTYGWLDPRIRYS